MSQEHVEAVKRLFAAVRQGDQAGVLEAYHPEVVIHESPSLPYGGDYHGHAEALRHLIRATFLLSLFNREGLSLCEHYWRP
jgi:ketosteroid isomerase-like protein